MSKMRPGLEYNFFNPEGPPKQVGIRVDDAASSSTTHAPQSEKQNNSATTAAKSSDHNQAGRRVEFVITIFDDGDEVRK
ncbi:hypothetical protein CDL15_Pgr022357 [Punica granatum]|uniref:Uncharacterized protein n=1 Tax=Punica granatum TaxID=22663 RepID=A0A218Y3G9_PUNGR|nr:hypothetical protein CDL15_Pgr022357 [Punica granatum]PKI69340.1 hypothetical protein CRG98_010274 [Punica granatum]